MISSDEQLLTISHFDEEVVTTVENLKVQTNPFLDSLVHHDHILEAR